MEIFLVTEYPPAEAGAAHAAKNSSKTPATEKLFFSIDLSSLATLLEIPEILLKVGSVHQAVK
jgi:hypothetical protein